MAQDSRGVPEGMRVSPETFRSRALECMRLAQALGASRHRTLLLELARSWAELANSAEAFQALVDRAAGPLRLRAGTVRRGRAKAATLH
jgi:hypothetical protein